MAKQLKANRRAREQNLDEERAILCRTWWEIK